jgi:hypothetical protein
MSEPNQIATSSIGEGLDFGCSLASTAIARAGDTSSAKCSQLLRELTSYVQFRYVGEYELALESLAFLGRSCDAGSFRAEQFWSQLRWVASEMQLTGDDLARIQLPEFMPNV